MAMSVAMTILPTVQIGKQARVSARFAVLFDYAQVPDFTAHDLRHEATCRWVELRSAGGGWLFSDVEICRIMGWSDPRMMLRYASLRGEDLAARLAGLVQQERPSARQGSSSSSA